MAVIGVLWVRAWSGNDCLGLGDGAQDGLDRGQGGKGNGIEGDGGVWDDGEAVDDDGDAERSGEELHDFCSMRGAGMEISSSTPDCTSPSMFGLPPSASKPARCKRGPASRRNTKRLKQEAPERQLPPRQQ
jgi:hypothetical protein